MHGVQPCKVVAVVVDASVSNSMRQSLVEAINSYVTPLGYVYLDASAVLQQHGGDTVSSVQSLCDEMKNSGQSRFVIIDFGSVEVSWRQHTPEVYKVHTAIEVVPEHTTLHPYSLDSSVQRVMLPLSSTLSCITEAELNSVLTSVFDPIVFFIIGNKLISPPDQLRVAANQFGFSFLTFDDIVSTEIERERDPSGPFTQAHRAHTTISSRFLLEALRRVIIHPASVRHHSLYATAQKFLLYGFPLENVDLKTLEQSVCRVSGVIRMGADDPAPSWLMSYEKRGLVASIEGLDCVEAGIRPVIAPDVILVSDGATSALELAARRQGLIWVNMTEKSQLHTPPNDVMATLKHILRCPGSGRNTFVLNSFPQTRQQAEQFYHSFGLPRLVIHTDKTANQEFAEMTSIFPPSVLQAKVPASEPLLLGMLNLKHIVCFVGDVQVLDADMVKRLIHGLGFSIVDLRREVLPADPSSVIVHILSAVRGTFTPRCVVIGAPGSTSVFQALEARLGSALNRIVVLKLRKPLPPPRSRNDDEEYYSDEEAEQQRQLLKEATSLSPELDQLVQYYKTTKQNKVSTLSFLKTDKLEEQLRPLVRPRLVGVLGHSHTFYREAFTTFCRRHQLPFIDLSTLLRESHTLSSKERFQRQLDALRATIAGSTASTFVVDGFPRALATDGSEAPTSAQCIGAPYIADQIRQLEISVAPIPVLVRCRASMDVLVERKPDNVTLNALADAQDLLEIATGDLVQHFETRKHRIVEISCDRDLGYACEQLDDALAAWL
ncbi:hypothetical protein Poli38472_002822 [Pythium oligandrum]|uniref:Uncharacterized protein n=1 Tax=Pythium oligandrum TaxID=41045 RepID=A0A8K1FEQ8_PYTOL|nr:hypothetical protein Poli38472_002822 [Pythium oligandrum]|eukprot:TMW56897.1 hypothetical protein Poli38472_002822 [Pythium oligandrum]